MPFFKMHVQCIGYFHIEGLFFSSYVHELNCVLSKALPSYLSASQVIYIVPVRGTLARIIKFLIYKSN